MTNHLLDSKGDHCRYPEWNDNGPEHGNRLIVCGKPGYPYCLECAAKVLDGRTRRRDAFEREQLLRERLGQ